MRTKIWTIGTAVMTGILFFSLSASAQMPIPAADQGKAHSRAAEHSPVIDKYPNGGLVLNPPGLEKIVFIHYKKGFGKPPWAGGGQKEKKSKCYAFLGKGLEWRNLPVDYVINPGNPYLLTDEFVGTAIQAAADEWERHSSSGLSGSFLVDEYADWDGDDGDRPDGRNELVFGDYGEPGVIAVTVVWGYFSGPPSMRGITEFDVLFDTDFSWGNAADGSWTMDLQNIATHEIGHGLGLADLYENACADETMYGYSDYGETKKRDLNDGDIAGIQKLYGAP